MRDKDEYGKYSVVSSSRMIPYADSYVLVIVIYQAICQLYLTPK